MSVPQPIALEVVGRFLQTVVVLDDLAYMAPEDDSLGGQDLNLVVPKTSAPVFEESGEAITEGDMFSHRLDAQSLIEGFAGRGLVCAVILPRKGHDESESTLRISKRADIVILDWQMDDQGQKATKIIRELLDEDLMAGGKLRFIAIYTAEPEIERIRDEVKRELSDTAVEWLELKTEDITLDTSTCRIAFLQKAQDAGDGRAVLAEDLADRLIHLYAEFTNGLLRSVALGAIAAIREETHQILARFPSELDGAFLSHRILSPRPSDAEDFAVGLMSSELHNAIESRAIGATYAGLDAISQCLARKREQEGLTSSIMIQANSEAALQDVTVEELMSLMTNGPKEVTKIANGGGKGSLYKRSQRLFYNSLDLASQGNYEFSRISDFKRELQNRPEYWTPRLNLGTIVRHDGNYLVCVQPSCDCVGLEGRTAFAFLTLTRGEDYFDHVVLAPEGDHIRLAADCRLANVRTFEFEPLNPGESILAKMQGTRSAFSAIGGLDLEWIADLRETAGQRISYRLATNLSRIGLNEFEWKRQHSTWKGD